MLETEATLYRTRAGRVHLHTCRHLARAQAYPWLWAEGKTLADAFAKAWNVPCMTCLGQTVDDYALDLHRVGISGGELNVR